MPVNNPMSGTGRRWKPLRAQIFFLAVEPQLPLNGQNGASDTMLLEAAARSDLFPRRRTAVAAERTKWRIRYHAARQRLIL